MERTVVARLTSLSEYDVDDSRRPFGAVFRRRVGDNLDTVDRFGRELLENLRAVLGSKPCGTSVEPNLDTFGATERNSTVGRDLHRGDILQNIARRRSGRYGACRYIENLLVELETHLRFGSFDRYFAQGGSLSRKLEVEIDNALVGVADDCLRILDVVVCR